ncbi:MAG: superoxide dismutase family protein [Gammaproteobacteria bacterium]|nr:superoxide dismutase family protein [Gammaproteobacteria bacterium]
MLKRSFTTFIFLCFGLNTYASNITVKIYGTGDEHQAKGTISFEDSPGGLLIKPHLHDLPPGPHGFHIHQNPSCRNEGMAAGGHFDPKQTNTHLGPYENGHQGDLPVIYVNADNESSSSLIAPHLNIENIKGHSIIIHAGGDNYTNAPPMGGGGPRIACGVIR